MLFQEAIHLDPFTPSLGFQAKQELFHKLTKRNITERLELPDGLPGNLVQAFMFASELQLAKSFLFTLVDATFLDTNIFCLSLFYTILH